MGASTSMVIALIFIGFIVVAITTYSSFDYYNNLVKKAQNDQDTMKKAKMQTYITITNVSLLNNCLTITLNNAGKTTLNASLLDIIVNGTYYGSSYCTSTINTWVPESSQKIVFCSAQIITIDNSTSSSIGAASSMTWSHTVGSGVSNSLLVVGVDISKGVIAKVTNITYAGVPLTNAAISVSAQGMRAEIWYLTNPTAGANSIVVNFNKTLSADGAVAGAVSFSGVDQTNPIPTTATSYGNGQNPSNSITTVNANASIIDTLARSAGALPSPNSPQVQRWSRGSGGMSGAGSTKDTTTAGSQTMSWTVSSSDWAWAAAEIKPIGCNAPTGGRIKVVTENGISAYALSP